MGMEDDFENMPVRPPLGEAELKLRERLRRHVDALAGVIGPRHMEAPGTLETAANYVERELTAVAGETVVRHRFPVGNDWAENLLVERRGTQRPDRVLVVGAHYDTVPETPGADDNASAVAMLVEAARVLAGRDAKYTLRFVAFANEEAPHHDLGTMGSDHYARHCAAKQGTRVMRVATRIKKRTRWSPSRCWARVPPWNTSCRTCGFVVVSFYVLSN